MDKKLYDIAIVGGGLAGLSLAIQSAKAGYRTVLLEKESYPYHKVCGEYISLESWNFLELLGVPLASMQLPIIKELQVTSPDGKQFSQTLPLGGFGISRYTLDQQLANMAIAAGVQLLEQTKVTQVQFEKDVFTIESNRQTITARVVASSFGKRSNLDIKWNRPFITQKADKLNNYIGVKYHIQIDYPDDVIALHNFENGYCGISRIEEGKTCLCYLTTAQNLRENNNNIRQMEEAVLFKNPYLKKIFESATFLYNAPVTISQISFHKKSQVHDHQLLIGDAAGMITPLCGNGMSMALHGSKLAFEQVHLFLQEKISRHQMEEQYRDQWQQHFSKRLATGRLIQRFFGKSRVTNWFVAAFNRFPLLATPLIRQTHGQPF
jgi:flavin-dependent dehydrogenase